MAYYGVYQGRNPGAYDNWPDCKEQVSGYSNADFRRFDSEEEALEYATKGGFVHNVFVDGACRGNGRHYWPDAGYGVYYGPDDSRNVAVPLGTSEDIKPTNQRAELYALLHALRNVREDLSSWYGSNHPVQILSDSQYAVRSFNEWSNKWRNNGWLNCYGDTIANVDLIQEMVELKDYINSEYDDKGWGEIDVDYVQGHAGNLANEEADRLANLGADRL